MNKYNILDKVRFKFPERYCQGNDIFEGGIYGMRFDGEKIDYAIKPNPNPGHPLYHYIDESDIISKIEEPTE